MMFLLRQKVKAKSISHPLTNQAIENIKLLINIAGQYATISKSDSHDLVSEALLALVAAKSPELNGHVISKIHTALSKYIKTDHLIRVPYKTNRNRIKRGLQPIVLVRRDFDHLNREREGGQNLIELEEILELSIRSNTERDVIRYRREGYSDNEIGNRLGLTRQKVYELRGRVKERFASMYFN